MLDGNDLTGNADPVCKSEELDVTFFVTDCDDPGEITCDCCSECCNDNNATCNNFAFNGNLDPIWEYGYNRAAYMFNNASAIEQEQP